MDEEGVVEFDVPLGLLPTVFPPGTGEGEGAAGVANGALVRAGEEGERVLIVAAFFGGDINRDGGTLAFEREMAGGMNFGNKWSLKIGSDG